MKRITCLAVVPIVAALGACSNGGASNAQPTSTNDGGGAAGDGGAPGDDASAGDDGANPTTAYEADLSGAQVVPTPVQTGASGKGQFTLSGDGMTLAYNIAFSPADFVPTAVNLHLGAVGENATVTHQLSPVSNRMSGQVTLTMDEQAVINSGGLYVDAQTQANPSGEIRGQIVLPGAEIFVAYPTGQQQVPSVNSAYTAHAGFILSPDMGTLIYHVATGATPTDVRLHRAIAGVVGPVAYDLPVGSSPIDGSVAIGGTAGNSDPSDLENGHFYLNIVTQQNPAGELRGQLIRPGERLFSGVLAGANEVPPVPSQATGGAQLILGPDQSSVRYETLVSGIIPNAVELAAAPAGHNGPLVLQLTLNKTGALGTAMMMSPDVQTLLAGGIYANVKTPSYPSGELRAQLLAQ
ncbi:MAG TPA: CHRD domain-containing protein [Polyangiaceae bacterium]|nr:CHRD domain-containing protein [Polyangiaceae bacterium]